jgi:hypothetical protein
MAYQLQQPSGSSGSEPDYETTRSAILSGSDRYLYTTGGDENLLHTKVLGSGGFGNVHEVSVLLFALTCVDVQRPSWTGICEEIDAGSTS